MRMPRHTLKLLVLLLEFSVAPASAGHHAAMVSASQHESDCPYERARLAALAEQDGGPTTITLTDRVPAESSLSGPGSGFLAP
jgi:hypothetical protein